MTRNIGPLDGWLRIVVGVVLLISGGVVLKRWWGLLGVILIAEGLLRWCLLYQPLGISTSNTKRP